MHYISVKNIIVGVCILLTIPTISCYGRGKIAQYIEKQQPVISETDISAIQDISIDQLRHAYDSKTGALYFAGVLWFFNDDIERAEIAWRRSARTGVPPWSIESLRLVCYSMLLSQRYNQIPVLLDSMSDLDTIIHTDPEIFSYYTLALWLNKHYEVLQEILEHAPSFAPTLRSRVSPQQALFNYDLWSALLKIRENIERTDTLLHELFMKYPLRYNNSEIPIFLSSIPQYTPELLSEHTAALLTLRTETLSAREQFDIVMSLPPHVFKSPWIVMDTAALFPSLSSTHKKKMTALFRALVPDTDDAFTRGIITLALAEFEYQQNRFVNSSALYEEGKKLVESSKIDATEHTLIQQFIHRTNWRYLYSIIHTRHANFFQTFISITNTVQNPEYYSNLIDEYLSYLLQKNYTQEIIDQYEDVKDILTHPSHKIKLLHWQSILSQIDKVYETDLVLLDLAPNYTSELLFDYFVNHQQNISMSSFIENFTHHADDAMVATEADAFINGFLDFGLLQYGYDVAIENIDKLNIDSLYSLARALHTEGDSIKALNIMRTAAHRNKRIVKDVDALRMLYPTPYIDIVKNITSSPIEQALLMGIIREESGFNTTAVSHAGAIGLAQLLHTTALDIADRIEYNRNFDLTHPQDNIVLGYNYYVYLVRILDSPLKAIASYNGGLGNVWKWETIYDTDNLILFTDSLPFRETRRYVRKVITSAIMYGLLYFDLPPQQLQSYLFSTQ